MKHRIDLEPRAPSQAGGRPGSREACILVASLLLLLMAMAGVAHAQAPPSSREDHGGESAEVAVPLRRTWAPPDIDAAVPPVRRDVACPLPEVLAGAGRRLQALVESLQQFSARERVEDMNVDKRGHVHAPESATFTYVVEIHPSAEQGAVVREYRNGSQSRPFLDGVAATGTAAMALILLPEFIGDYSVTCEGLGELQGRPAWLLRFAQRPDRPASFRTYETPAGAVPVALKGRAWIAADTYQMLRIETSLVKPVPELRLYEDHVIVDYSPVEFRKQDVQLWLPQTADIYLDLQGRRFHRRLSFSRFELFWVDVSHTEELRPR